MKMLFSDLFLTHNLCANLVLAEPWIAIGAPPFSFLQVLGNTPHNSKSRDKICHFSASVKMSQEAFYTTILVRKACLF